jgi:pimeloyl-ACP methyl ester carboxylesterase
MKQTRLGAIGMLMVVSALLGGCTKPIDVAGEHDVARAAPGMVYSVEPAGGYPHLALRALIRWQGLADTFPTQYGVSMYRVRYWTTGADASLTVASGLVAFPRGSRLRGVVSFQHGTAPQRVSAPSTPDPNNGVLAAAAFAGRGYLLVAPDYVGLGVSTVPHPYLHADSEADAVVDLLRAARDVVAAAGLDWPGALLLTGFSQGGHATLAAQRLLEAAPIEGLTVKAAAPIAGPFDLAGVSFPFALEGGSKASSLYLAYMVGAYANTYGESLASALKGAYASKVPVLFDGLHDGNAIIAALPANPREMFREEFLQAYAGGEPNWLRERLTENGLYEWSPRAPIRLYFGALDVDVSPREADVEAKRLNARGGTVTAVDVGEFDHEASVLAAVPAVLAWFDQLTMPPV